MYKNICLAAAAVLLAVSLTAQTFPSAEGPRFSVWAGATVSTFNPDYGCVNNSPFSCWDRQLIGITPFANTNPFLFGRIGVEGRATFLHWRGPGGMSQSSYMAGPRVGLYRHKRLLLSASLLAGDARITVAAPAIGTGTYFAFAPGAVVEYRVAPRLCARADYQYQMWPGFKGSASGAGGLTPNGFSFGLSYAVLK